MVTKIEVCGLISAGIGTALMQDALSKIVISTVAMLIATTISYYWKRHLEKRHK